MNDSEVPILLKAATDIRNLGVRCGSVGFLPLVTNIWASANWNVTY